MLHGLITTNSPSETLTMILQILLALIYIARMQVGGLGFWQATLGRFFKDLFGHWWPRYTTNEPFPT